MSKGILLPLVIIIILAIITFGNGNIIPFKNTTGEYNRVVDTFVECESSITAPTDEILDLFNPKIQPLLSGFQLVKLRLLLEEEYEFNKNEGYFGPNPLRDVNNCLSKEPDFFRKYHESGVAVDDILQLSKNITLIKKGNTQINNNKLYWSHFTYTNPKSRDVFYLIMIDIHSGLDILRWHFMIGQEILTKHNNTLDGFHQNLIDEYFADLSL